MGTNEYRISLWRCCCGVSAVVARDDDWLEIANVTRTVLVW